MVKEIGVPNTTNDPSVVANPALDLQAMEILRSDNIRLLEKNKALEDENTRVRVIAVQMENQLASGINSICSKIQCYLTFKKIQNVALLKRI